MRRWLIVFVALVSLSTSALSFCNEPHEPNCIDGVVTFDDNFSFDFCKRDVEAFVSETEDYVRCLKRTSEEAVAKANGAIEKFNCRAKGSVVC